MQAKGHLPFPSGLNTNTALAVVVLFSIPDCTYCEKVRAQSLRHIEGDSRYKGRVRVFEIDFSDHRKNLLWFDGSTQTGKSIANALGVKFAPTVMVLSKTGQLAGEPILGSGLPDFYNAYVDEQIRRAWSF